MLRLVLPIGVVSVVVIVVGFDSVTGVESAVEVAGLDWGADVTVADCTVAVEVLGLDSVTGVDKALDVLGLDKVTGVESADEVGFCVAAGEVVAVVDVVDGVCFAELLSDTGQTTRGVPLLVEAAAVDGASGGAVEDVVVADGLDTVDVAVVDAAGFKVGVASGRSDSAGGSVTAAGVTDVTLGAVIFACEPVGTLGTVGVVA